jgi:hypothetical protein
MAFSMSRYFGLSEATARVKDETFGMNVRCFGASPCS